MYKVTMAGCCRSAPGRAAVGSGRWRSGTTPGPRPARAMAGAAAWRASFPHAGRWLRRPCRGRAPAGDQSPRRECTRSPPSSAQRTWGRGRTRPRATMPNRRCRPRRRRRCCRRDRRRHCARGVARGTGAGLGLALGQPRAHRMALGSMMARLTPLAWTTTGCRISHPTVVWGACRNWIFPPGSGCGRKTDGSSRRARTAAWINATPSPHQGERTLHVRQQFGCQHHVVTGGE